MVDAIPVSIELSKNYVIGFYNLENLFDTYNDPAKNDEEFLPEGKNKWTDAKYQKKLQNTRWWTTNSLRATSG